MQSAAELKNLLMRIDHRGYPAYKDTKGIYQFPGYQLSIDHVQGDPFAAPSRLSVRVSGKDAGFPADLYRTRCRRVALQDELTRRFAALTAHASHQAKGSGHSGLIAVSRCGQEVLERTACQLNPKTGDLLLRLEVGFPANGRTINARELEKILFELLPNCVRGALFFHNLDAARLRAVTDLAEDQQVIRDLLPKMGLSAFVADGSILPRSSGVSDLPMSGAIPFRSPDSLSVTLELPHRGRITGMGIPCGITLIVGGGYHGKSTLLRALERGVYDHIAGDGRKYVITDATAVKIRAEDGRSIRQADISAFINNLPGGRDTSCFSTEDASGSTSQAANVVEAIEAGSRLLLIDEDTSATNFMVRDELMQRVISRKMEPITPFIDRIRELYDRFGISTILVAGSSGAYFHPADRIIQMDHYLPREITELAKREAAAFPLSSSRPAPMSMPHFDRRPKSSAPQRGGDRIKLKVLGRDGLLIDRENLELRYLEQLADPEQAAALGCCLLYAQRHLFDGRRSLQQIVDALQQLIAEQGLTALWEGSSLPMALPRREELFACFDRWRSLRL